MPGYPELARGDAARDGWNMAFDHDAVRLGGIFDFADSGFGPPHREFVQVSLVDPQLAALSAAAYEARTGRTLDRRRILLLTAAQRLSELAGAVETGDDVDAMRDSVVDWYRQTALRGRDPGNLCRRRELRRGVGLRAAKEHTEPEARRSRLGRLKGLAQGAPTSTHGKDAEKAEQIELDRHIGCWKPYATSHDELDRDEAIQAEVRNAALGLAQAVIERHAGRLAVPGEHLSEPRQK